MGWLQRKKEKIWASVPPVVEPEALKKEILDCLRFYIQPTRESGYENVFAAHKVTNGNYNTIGESLLKPRRRVEYDLRKLNDIYHKYHPKEPFKGQNTLAWWIAGVFDYDIGQFGMPMPLIEDIHWDPKHWENCPLLFATDEVDVLSDDFDPSRYYKFNKKEYEQWLKEWEAVFAQLRKKWDF